MSSHDGISCDYCSTANFTGCRYKCLVCYDYDLCARCYQSNQISVNHLTTHPMQCILTRADYEIYYGFDAESMDFQPQSLTCPLCNLSGFSATQFYTHLRENHWEARTDVICPLCAATGYSNFRTVNLINHFSTEHHMGPRNGDEVIRTSDREANRSRVLSLFETISSSDERDSQHIYESNDLSSQLTAFRRLASSAHPNSNIEQLLRRIDSISRIGTMANVSMLRNELDAVLSAIKEVRNSSGGNNETNASIAEDEQQQTAAQTKGSSSTTKADVRVSELLSPQMKFSSPDSDDAAAKCLMNIILLAQLLLNKNMNGVMDFLTSSNAMSNESEESCSASLVLRPLLGSDGREASVGQEMPPNRLAID